MSDYTNKGILFTEREKRSDKSPDYTGKLNVGGTEYELAGWNRQGRDGGTFLSLSIKPAGDWKKKKDEQATLGTGPAWTPPKPKDIDDDVPF